MAHLIESQHISTSKLLRDHVMLDPVLLVQPIQERCAELWMICWTSEVHRALEQYTKG